MRYDWSENAVNMDEDDINKIINNDIKIEKNVVGKIFDDYSCKIVGILTKDKRIVEGETLNMMLSASNQIYKVEVDSVKQAEDNDKVIVVLTQDKNYRKKPFGKLSELIINLKYSIIFT
mgnify:CR=1 FL=1